MFRHLIMAIFRLYMKYLLSRLLYYFSYIPTQEQSLTFHMAICLLKLLSVQQKKVKQSHYRP